MRATFNRRVGSNGPTVHGRVARRTVLLRATPSPCGWEGPHPPSPHPPSLTHATRRHSTGPGTPTRTDPAGIRSNDESPRPPACRLVGSVGACVTHPRRGAAGRPGGGHPSRCVMALPDLADAAARTLDLYGFRRDLGRVGLGVSVIDALRSSRRLAHDTRLHVSTVERVRRMSS